MEEKDLDVDFNPKDFQVPDSWSIDNSFWEHIDENSTIPTSCKTRFYIPAAKARKAWPKMLRQKFNIEPFVSYDSEVITLPNKITPEEIEEHRLVMNKYLVKSLDDPTPVGPPEQLSVERYLRSKNISILADLSFGKKWENLTDKEKLISRWRPDYGFLWDHREGEGTFFPQPSSLKALKFEVISEYFFHIPGMPQLILSVGCEPNTERPVYGFRREFSLDWPCDRIWTGVDYENGKPKPRYVSVPDEIVEKNIVLPMNRLIQNLEYLLEK